MSYADYKAQMTRNREALDETERSITLEAADVAFFQALPQPLHVVVLAEDWCGDVIANLPVLARLAEESGKLDVRIFLRDQNLDIMDQYLKEGQFRAIPLFVFFDQEFQELGHWIERPARMTELTQQMRRNLFATDALLSAYAPTTSPSELPDEARARLSQANSSFRAENRGLSVREVVRELRDVVSGKPQSATTIPLAGGQMAAGKMPGTQSNGTPTRPSQGQTQGQTQANETLKVSITYCAECGYEPQTLALAGALMRAFRHQIGTIELLPWQDGAFDVAINGELVHSMMRDGGFPEDAAIISAVRERLPLRVA